MKYNDFFKKPLKRQATLAKDKEQASQLWTFAIRGARTTYKYANHGNRDEMARWCQSTFGMSPQKANDALLDRVDEVAAIIRYWRDQLETIRKGESPRDVKVAEALIDKLEKAKGHMQSFARWVVD